jgi:hypothetical protein
MAVADMTQRLRPYLIWAALLIAGVIVGYSLPSNSVSPKSEIGVVKVVRGTMSGEDANFTFKQTGSKNKPVRYFIEDPTPWQATSNGPWNHHGKPACLKPGAKVTLGVVNVRPVGAAQGKSMVVWMECYS